MRAIPQTFQDQLDSGATTFCWCWKIIRSDGVILGFTEHDSDLQFDGIVWRSGASLMPGVIETAIGFSPNAGVARGALLQSGISADDIDRGKYKQAAIEIWRVNWQDTTLRVGVWSGEIGEVTRKEHAFEAEIAGPARKLNRSFGRVFSKLCDAELGDQRCTKDVSSSPFLVQSSIIQVLDVAQFSVAAFTTLEPDWFSAGTVSWINGANAGQTLRIAQYFHNGSEDVFTLAAIPAKPMAPGDAVSLLAGCNKSLDHCELKFSNTLNFQGCPFMPGNDAIIAGPVPTQ
jgi:uncharacterized phage protein (TIGR02218 family)